MKIPVFVSCPTVLRKSQENSRKVIVNELAKLRLEPRALGRTDYPTDFPLKEILVLANHCSGGVILGFEQFRADSGIWKRDTEEKKPAKEPVPFPTPWNHLETGIMFSLGIPLLVFKEKGISGGVFDSGVTDLFVHEMPAGRLSKAGQTALTDVFLKWQAQVRFRYYHK